MMLDVSNNIAEAPDRGYAGKAIIAAGLLAATAFGGKIIEDSNGIVLAQEQTQPPSETRDPNLGVGFEVPSFYSNDATVNPEYIETLYPDLHISIVDFFTKIAVPGLDAQKFDQVVNLYYECNAQGIDLGFNGVLMVDEEGQVKSALIDSFHCSRRVDVEPYSETTARSSESIISTDISDNEVAKLVVNQITSSFDNSQMSYHGSLTANRALIGKPLVIANDGNLYIGQSLHSFESNGVVINSDQDIIDKAVGMFLQNPCKFVYYPLASESLIGVKHYLLEMEEGSLHICVMKGTSMFPQHTLRGISLSGLENIVSENTYKKMVEDLRDAGYNPVPGQETRVITLKLLNADTGEEESVEIGGTANPNIYTALFYSPREVEEYIEEEGGLDLKAIAGALLVGFGITGVTLNLMHYARKRSQIRRMRTAAENIESLAIETSKTIEGEPSNVAQYINAKVKNLNFELDELALVDIGITLFNPASLYSDKERLGILVKEIESRLANTTGDHGVTAEVNLDQYFNILKSIYASGKHNITSPNNFFNRVVTEYFTPLRPARGNLDINTYNQNVRKYNERSKRISNYKSIQCT